MQQNKKQPPLTTGKIPPQAPEMEQAVIGACLLERDALEQVIEILPNHEMFYVNAHQTIYDAMLQLLNEGSPIDLLTVTAKLTKMGKLDEVGGAYAITKLSSAVMSSAHVKHHAMYIAEKYSARELIRICGQAIQGAYDGVDDIFDICNHTSMSISNINEGTSQSNATPVGDTYVEILMDIEAQKEQPDQLPGIDTGYREINEITNGWQDSELIILAARPSQGKTAFALNLAMNAAISTTKGCDVLVFSLEASKKALVKRLAACKNDVYYGDIRKGVLNTFQEKKMADAIRTFQTMRMKIDDKSQSLPHIIAACRKEKKKRPNLKLVIIDYLQLIKGLKEKNGNREQEVSNITRELKLLSSELEIPIIALSQLNRETMKQAGGKPGLHNLRESGAIEQDANIVMFIWHEDTGEPDNKGGTMFKTHILFEKNRDGECKSVELKFSGDIQRWASLNDAVERETFKPYAGFQNTSRKPYQEDEPF